MAIKTCFLVLLKILPRSIPEEYICKITPLDSDYVQSQFCPQRQTLSIWPILIRFHLKADQVKSLQMLKNAIFWDVMPCGSLTTDVSEN
jgi:hypothetical protein